MDYTEILEALNAVFEGEYTKVVREDAEALYVYDASTREVLRFEKGFLGVNNG